MHSFIISEHAFIVNEKRDKIISFSIELKYSYMI